MRVQISSVLQRIYIDSTFFNEIKIEQKWEIQKKGNKQISYQKAIQIAFWFAFRVNYIHFQQRQMILLDLENLNILFLFILAFVSFKGYQADANLFDSESEQEISEGEQESSKHHRSQEDNQSSKQNSQSAHSPQLVTQMKRDEEKTNDSIPEPEKMIGEEIKELKNAQDSSENGIIADSNLQEFARSEQYSQLIGDQEERQKIEEKCDQEKFDSFSYSSPSESNSDLDSLEDDSSEKNPEAPEKLKKIKKMAKQLKRDLKKQSQLIQILSKDVELEIQ